jgi:hypothetical protein
MSAAVSILVKYISEATVKNTQNKIPFIKPATSVESGVYRYF